MIVFNAYHIRSIYLYCNTMNKVKYTKVCELFMSDAGTLYRRHHGFNCKLN